MKRFDFTFRVNCSKLQAHGPWFDHLSRGEEEAYGLETEGLNVCRLAHSAVIFFFLFLKGGCDGQGPYTCVFQPNGRKLNEGEGDFVCSSNHRSLLVTAPTTLAVL